jgi:hypothetical protein
MHDLQGDGFWTNTMTDGLTIDYGRYRAYFAASADDKQGSLPGVRR